MNRSAGIHLVEGGSVQFGVQYLAYLPNGELVVAWHDSAADGPSFADLPADWRQWALKNAQQAIPMDMLMTREELAQYREMQRRAQTDARKREIGIL